ncbi:prorelaxin-like [Manis javanica]|uniref:prorelaxin-like n=1 Tax=Manis javanica TaxID=9974 RepID=UPI00187A191A|nr:prorelaxin-like [Manis javanica]KAI5934394.1 Prorelaxin H1 [Manis javanica]
MLHLFLSHLLGIWLLLSQLPREVPGETDKLIRACGRELVRIRIELCGTMPWRKRDQGQKPLLEFEQLAEIMPSSITEDAETLNTMLEFIPHWPQKTNETVSEKQLSLPELQKPALRDTNLNFEEFHKNIRRRQNQKEENNNSELKNSGLEKHSREERQVLISLADKCCSIGCSVKELAKIC